VTAFLSHLATRLKVSASTQNQALAALLFLYGSVLEQDLPWLNGLVRAKRPQRLPVVLTRREVRAVLAQLSGPPHLVATLLYGAGLRLLEALHLRIQEVDLEARILTIRSGKGDRDRRATLPDSARAGLARAMEAALAQHRQDLNEGAGYVELPSALARKYPSAARSPSWQWVFPATRTYRTHGLRLPQPRTLQDGDLLPLRRPRPPTRDPHETLKPPNEIGRSEGLQATCG